MRILVGLIVLALVMPASANLLSDANASFEVPADGGSPSTGNWVGMTIDFNKYTLPAKRGLHYAGFGAGSGGSGTWTAQLVVAVPASTNVVLTGFIAGGGGNASIWIQLIDGASTSDTVRQTFSISPVTGGVAWTPFTLTGHITTGSVKIKAGVHGGAWGAHVCHLDALNLTPEPASLALFGLAGLPLLRRRP